LSNCPINQVFEELMKIRVEKGRIKEGIRKNKKIFMKTLYKI